MGHLFMNAFYFKHLTEGTPLFIFASFSNLPRQAEDTIKKMSEFQIQIRSIYQGNGNKLPT